MDLDSVAKLWLFYEAGGEISVNGSVYFYKENDKKGDGKLHAVYPWDVEHSFCAEDKIEMNVMADHNRDSANGIWYSLYLQDDFRQAVYENWIHTFRPAMEKLLEEGTEENPDGVTPLSCYTERYESASYYNELLWGEEQSIEKKADFIRKFVKGRIDYLDESLKPE